MRGNVYVHSRPFELDTRCDFFKFSIEFVPAPFLILDGTPRVRVIDDLDSYGRFKNYVMS